MLRDLGFGVAVCTTTLGVAFPGFGFSLDFAGFLEFRGFGCCFLGFWGFPWFWLFVGCLLWILARFLNLSGFLPCGFCDFA